MHLLFLPDGLPDRFCFGTYPADHEEWYRKHCCPACGLVNETGELCPPSWLHHCLCCGVAVCGNIAGRCPRCGGVMGGYGGSEKKYADCPCHAKKSRRRLSESDREHCDFMKENP